MLSTTAIGHLSVHHNRAGIPVSGQKSSVLHRQCCGRLLYFVKLVTLANQSFDLPEHPVDAIGLLCNLEHLLVLEVVKAVANSCAEFSSELISQMLPFQSEASIVVAVQ